MYTWGEGGIVCTVFNDLEKIHQYSDEKSAKPVSLDFNFLVC
jgi:hypothetical protein